MPKDILYKDGLRRGMLNNGGSGIAVSIDRDEVEKNIFELTKLGDYTSNKELFGVYVGELITLFSNILEMDTPDNVVNIAYIYFQGIEIHSLFVKTSDEKEIADLFDEEKKRVFLRITQKIRDAISYKWNIFRKSNLELGGFRFWSTPFFFFFQHSRDVLF